MSIGEICNRQVAIAERALSVTEAARLMRQFHVGDIVVVEEVEGGRRPLGIVTDRDIVVEVVAAEVVPNTLAVGDIMSTDLARVNEGMGVFEAMRSMRERGVRRMPVVDEGGRLVGIVTLDDLLELLAEEMGELAGLISREGKREEQNRR